MTVQPSQGRPIQILAQADTHTDERQVRCGLTTAVHAYMTGWPPGVHREALLVDGPQKLIHSNQPTVFA